MYCVTFVAVGSYMSVNYIPTQLKSSHRSFQVIPASCYLETQTWIISADNLLSGLNQF